MTPKIPQLRLDPGIVAAVSDGRAELLLRGAVAQGDDLDQLAVLHEGALCNRVVFGRAPGEGDAGGGAGRGFAVVVARAADMLGRDTVFHIEMTTHSGAVVREAVTVRLRRGRVPQAAYAAHPCVRPVAADGALLLQVETARIEAGRLIVRGFVVSPRPLLVVGASLGHAHCGNARLGLCREEIRVAFPLHASHAQFLGNFALPEQAAADLGAGAIPAAVRVQVILADGDSQEAEIPLRMEPGAAALGDAAEGRASRAIQVHCDTAALGEDGDVTVTGWCVAEHGVRTVRVLLDGAVLGPAEYGGARADVAAAFPDLPGAAACGFAFAGRVADPPADATLLLRAEDNEGREAVLRVPVQRMQVAASEEALKLNLDTPEIADGLAVQAVTGHMTIEGWLLAQSPVASVDVLLDGERLGEAYFGLARPDVAQAFPEHPRGLRSGFTFHCPPRALRDGAHHVGLVFRLQSGFVHTEKFRIVVRKADGADEGGRIRERMGAAERAHRARVRAALGAAPPFVIHVRGGAAGETLDSLRAQCVPWTLAAGQAPPDALHVVLNAGDRLGADALDEFFRAAVTVPDAAVFYGDENAVFAGERAAYLKPGFSPELLLATNYIGTGFAVRHAALAAAGLAPADLALLTPYDVLLRVTEHGTAHHIPALLVERGAVPPAPPWEEGAVVQAALTRRGIGGRVVAGRVPGTWRAMPAAPFVQKVSVIVPTRGAENHIVACLRGLRAGTAHKAVEIVVIDNISDTLQPLRAHVAAHADRVVRIDAPFNWSAFNNAAARHATGEFLLFLNDDIEIADPFWLDAMLELVMRPGVGAVGPQLLYPDGRVQHAGMFLSPDPSGGGIGRHVFRFARGDDPRYFGLALTQRNVIAVTGACMMVARKTFETLGGFDEAHDVINNDLDFCLRLHEAGLRTVYTPAASLTHHELASRAGRAETFDAARFTARWAELFARGDPYFHRGFSGGCDDMRPEEEPVVEIFGGHPLFAREEIRRICVVKVDHIGDFVTAIPVFRRLKRGFPAAHLTVVAAPGVRGLAALEPAIDAFVPYAFFHAKSALGRADADAGAAAALEALLRAENFDLAIDLRKHPDTRPLLRRTGARHLAGYDYQGQFPWLDVALEWEGDRGLHPKRFHVTDDLAHLVDAVMAAADEDRTGFSTLPPPVPLPARAEALFRRPVCCVHAGAGNPLKEWPAAYFVALCARLLRETDVALLFVGGPDEVDATDAILRALRAATGTRGRLESVAGKIALRDLPALMARCACYVGNDSGPKHMAAAAGVPVVGIHSGSVDPQEWAPLGADAIAVYRTVTCSPCYISDASRCPRRIACMTGIAPDQVFAAVRRMLLLGHGHAPGQALDHGARAAITPARSRSSAG